MYVAPLLYEERRSASTVLNFADDTSTSFSTHRKWVNIFFIRFIEYTLINQTDSYNM